MSVLKSFLDACDESVVIVSSLKFKGGSSGVPTYFITDEDSDSTGDGKPDDCTDDPDAPTTDTLPTRF